jgi:hypothetical protein
MNKFGRTYSRKIIFPEKSLIRSGSGNGYGNCMVTIDFDCSKQESFLRFFEYSNVFHKRIVMHYLKNKEHCFP